MRFVLSTLSALAALAAAGLPAAAQDAAAGERLYLQCRTCHQIGENARNAVGPPLNGLFDGRKKGTFPGYTYSNAYQAIRDQDWTVENFTTYIKDPRGVTPGTKMVYPGLKDDAQIAHLVAFLRQYGPDGKKR